MSSSAAESVKVIVRCRPINGRERVLKCKSIVQMNDSNCTCSLISPNDPTAPPKCFTFDGVYNENSTTEQIYNEIAYSLIEGVLDGYNSTIFAYGQTGCGKSFSMQGVQDPLSQRGIISRAFEHVFEAISLAEDYKYLVLASYLEIYNEEIRDLLSSDTKKNLDLKENPDRGVYVNDLTYHAVHNVLECQRLMEQGWRNRAVGATLMNADSSRSHSIFCISVEMMPVSDSLESTSIRRGKLNLVDLAGSERQTKTGATGDRLKEATKINLSLSALGNVISALVDGKAKHIPYRDSKLTRLLQDSLGGNTKTLMVACLSPADNNYDETLSTLRYANRAKNIRNKPHVNEDPKDTMLREYQEEIRRLRQLLENTQLNVIHDDNNNIDNSAVKNSDISANSSIQARKDDLQIEYDRKMEILQKQYEDEYKSKCQMEEHLLNLKKQYEQDMAKLNKQIQEVPKKDDMKILKSEETVANVVQQEIVKRINKLQSSMVGGERVNDRELRERRLKKKREAERRLNMLAQIVSKVDDVEGPLVLKVYDDIQEELKVKTDVLRKYKQKVKALDREITDLQSEFERERTDYLETIRKQERQIKLLNQILEVIIPALSKECNYSDLDRIKEESKWIEDSQSWQLPELLNSTIKLPPATAPGKLENPKERSYDNNRRYSSCENLSEELLPPKQRLDVYDMDNFAGNYFKPRRATELLLQARENATKAVARWKDSLQQTRVHTLAHSDSALSGMNNSKISNGGSYSKSKFNVNAQLNDIAGGGSRSSRTWNGQTSPITWMTGNVRMSPEMLSKRPGRIDLLPLIHEKKPPKRLVDF